MNYTEMLFKVIPKHEIESVLRCPTCELDREFLGFVEVYGSVLNFVPKHFTIVDLGCYVATQAYLFKDYEKYIGVDVCELERFKPENAIHYQITIQEYLLKHTNDLCLETTFAICSYLPDEEPVQIAGSAIPKNNIAIGFGVDLKKMNPAQAIILMMQH